MAWNINSTGGRSSVATSSDRIGRPSTEALTTGLLGSANNLLTLFDSTKFDLTSSNGIFCVGYAGTSSTSGPPSHSAHVPALNGGFRST